MESKGAKKFTSPPWLPSNVPAEHYSGFVNRHERPCASHAMLGLGCIHKPQVELALWQHRQSNGALTQIYHCVECGSMLSSGVKQLPCAKSRTDSDHEQIASEYKAKVAAALPDDLTREDFLDSMTWINIREHILELDGYRCRICGGIAEEVHHRSNENYQTPREEDLVSLCRRCHEAIHCLNPFEREHKGASADWPGHRYRCRTPRP